MSDGYRADCIREHEQIQKQLCKIEHDKGHPEGQCEHCRQELTSLRAQLAEANERVKYLEAGRQGRNERG